MQMSLAVSRMTGVNRLSDSWIGGRPYAVYRDKTRNVGGTTGEQ